MVNLSLEHCGRTSDLIYKLAWRPAQEISLFAHLSFSPYLMLRVASVPLSTTAA